MAEEEKKAALLDSTILERRKKCREEFLFRKKCREEFLVRNGRSRKKGLPEEEESMLRTTLLNEARKHMEKFMEDEDSVPAIGVSIGGYSCFTGKHVTVRACFLYKMQQLEWEIVEGPLRRRLCLKWDDIDGLELKLNECGLACLTVEVNCSPTFMMYNPDFKRWLCSENFTDHDEVEFNLLPHHVVFKPGTVDVCFERLLNYRKELALVRAKHMQRVQKKLLRLDKQFTLKKNLRQFLESKRHRQLEKEENK